MDFYFDSGARTGYYARLMLDTLPERLDLASLAERGASLQGELAVSGMPRLAPLLLGDQRTLQVQLRFGKDAEGVHYLECSIGGGLNMTCQRCLGPVYVPVSSSSRLAQATDGRAAQYDALQNDDPFVVTRTLVEDELLLAVPVVPMHGSTETCRLPAGTEDTQEQGGREHPFANLNALKRKQQES